MNLKFFLLIAVLFNCSIIFISCNHANEYEDIEVSILSTINEERSLPNDPISTTWAIISYNIENLGTKKVNGWNIFFNVNLEKGPQIIASDYVAHVIEPGQISSLKKTSVLIPSYYEKATGAVLKDIDTW